MKLELDATWSAQRDTNGVVTVYLNELEVLELPAVVFPDHSEDEDGWSVSTVIVLTVSRWLERVNTLLEEQHHHGLNC